MTQPTWNIINDDALHALQLMPDNSVDTIITSPPYYGLREYGTATWEGGDPHCDHQKETIRKRRNLAQAANACDGGNRKANDRADHDTLGLYYRDTCRIPMSRKKPACRKACRMPRPINRRNRAFGESVFGHAS